MIFYLYIYFVRDIYVQGIPVVGHESEFGAISCSPCSSGTLSCCDILE